MGLRVDQLREALLQGQRAGAAKSLDLKPDQLIPQSNGAPGANGGFMQEWGRGMTGQAGGYAENTIGSPPPAQPRVPMTPAPVSAFTSGPAPVQPVIPAAPPAAAPPMAPAPSGYTMPQRQTGPYTMPGAPAPLPISPPVGQTPQEKAADLQKQLLMKAPMPQQQAAPPAPARPGLQQVDTGARRYPDPMPSTPTNPPAPAAPVQQQQVQWAESIPPVGTVAKSEGPEKRRRFLEDRAKRWSDAGVPKTADDIAKDYDNDPVAIERARLDDQYNKIMNGDLDPAAPVGVRHLQMVLQQGQDLNGALGDAGPAGFFQTMKEKWGTEKDFHSRLPLAGPARDAGVDRMVGEKVDRIVAGQGTAADLRDVRMYLLDEAVQNRERSTGGGVASVISDLPGFMGEMAASNSIARTIETGLARLAPGLAGTMLGRGAEAALSAAGRSFAPAFAGRVAKGAAEEMRPAEIGGPDREFGEAVVRALGTNAIEVFTETAGGAAINKVAGGIGKFAGSKLAKLPVPQRVAGMQQAIAAKWLASGTGRTFNALGKRLAEVGYHGVATEVLEEEMAKAMRAGVGLEEYRATTLEELKIQAMAFAVLPAGQALIAGTANAADRVIRGDEAAAEEDARQFMAEKLAGMSEDEVRATAKDLGMGPAAIDRFDREQLVQNIINGVVQTQEQEAASPANAWESRTDAYVRDRAMQTGMGGGEASNTPGPTKPAGPWDAKEIPTEQAVAEAKRQAAFQLPRAGQDQAATERHARGNWKMVEKEAEFNGGYVLANVPVNALTVRKSHIDQPRSDRLEQIGGTNDPIFITTHGVRDGKTGKAILDVDNGNNRVVYARKHGIATIPAIISRKALEEFAADNPNAVETPLSTAPRRLAAEGESAFRPDTTMGQMERKALPPQPAEPEGEALPPEALDQTQPVGEPTIPQPDSVSSDGMTATFAGEGREQDARAYAENLEATLGRDESKGGVYGATVTVKPILGGAGTSVVVNIPENPNEASDAQAVQPEAASPVESAAPVRPAEGSEGSEGDGGLAGPVAPGAAAGESGQGEETAANAVKTSDFIKAVKDYAGGKPETLDALLASASDADLERLLSKNEKQGTTQLRKRIDDAIMGELESRPSARLERGKDGKPNAHVDNFRILADEAGVGDSPTEMSEADLKKWLDTADAIGMGDMARQSAKSNRHNVPKNRLAMFDRLVGGEQPQTPPSKEPWQMTKAEWNAAVDDANRFDAGFRNKSTGEVYNVGPVHTPPPGFTENTVNSLEAGVIDRSTGKFMSRDEFGKTNVLLRLAKQMKAGGKGHEFVHSGAVGDAIRDGKDVPPEVLADYPDLQKKPATAPQPRTIKLYRGGGKAGLWWSSSEDLAKAFAPKGEAPISEDVTLNKVMDLTTLKPTDHVTFAGIAGKMGVLGLDLREAARKGGKAGEALADAPAVRLHSLLENKGVLDLLRGKGYDALELREGLTGPNEGLQSAFLRIPPDEPKAPKNGGYTLDDLVDLGVDLGNRSAAYFNGHEVHLKEGPNGWYVSHKMPEGYTVKKGGVGFNQWSRSEAHKKGVEEIRSALPAAKAAEAPKPANPIGAFERKFLKDAIAKAEGMGLTVGSGIKAAAAAYESGDAKKIAEWPTIQDTISLVAKQIREAEEKAPAPKPPATKPPTKSKPKSVLDNLSPEDRARAEELKAKLKKKLGGGDAQVNMGFDAELLSMGVELGYIYAKGGAVSFGKFASQMVNELGDGIKPYLKSIYLGVRGLPDVDRKSMTPSAEVEDLTTEEVDTILAKEQDEDAEGEQADEDQPEEQEQADVDPFIAAAREIVLSDDKPISKAAAMKRLAKEHDLTLKQVQERVESVLADITREVANDPAMTERQKFDRLVAIYDNQPRFSNRTSTSIENQAYSTPIPLAFAASRMIPVWDGQVAYEPTAGHAVLLMERDKGTSLVNEIDDERRASLQRQGFAHITDKDATTYVPGKPYSVVLMNPPFGGAPKLTFYKGFHLAKLEHVIAVKALEGMDDNGAAVMILGANLQPGKLGTADKVFLNYLMGHFNVVGNFEVSGDLYAAQGASFPVRVIALAGRKANPTVDKVAPDSVPRLDTWEQVYNQISEVRRGIESFTNRVEPGERSPDADSPAQGGTDAADAASPAGGAGGNATKPGGRGGRGGKGGGSRPPGGRKPGSAPQPGSGQPGVPGGPVSPPDAGRGDGDAVEADGEGSADEAPQPPFPDEGGAGEPQGDDAERVPGSSRPLIPVANLHHKYIPKSSSPPLDTLSPKFMTAVAFKATDELEARVGNIDAFVAKKLGYSSIADMHKGLAGEQIDGIALAIDQIDKGAGMIIGDETGIGKGRQAAAIIRYAQQQGWTPVFVTKDPKLFSDMWGDLQAIGSKVKPLLVGDTSKSHIRNINNEVIYSAESGEKQRAIMSRFASGEDDALSGYDAIFTNYSQFNTPNQQQRFLERVSKAMPTIVILDESHEGSGDESMQGVFLRGGKIEVGKGQNREELTYKGLLNGTGIKGAVYLSATYAKRPDSMPLYFKTAIGTAVDNVASLVEIMKKGGVALQQVVADNLAQAGQYIRRERDFTGVPFRFEVHRGSDEKKIVKEIDDVAQILREIVGFSSLVVSEIKEQNKGRATANTGSSMGVSEFSSVVHNYVSQMLLASKADPVADMAIDLLKKGEKPVITLVNTMGSFMEEYVDDNSLKNGDAIDMSFADVLKRALDRTLRVSEKDAQGNSETYFVTPAELGLQNEYERVAAMIEDMDTDLPVSPIDWIHHRIRKAGYVTDEVTARTHTIDYSGDEPAYQARSQKEINDKNRHINDFNAGKTDAMILNAAGSTGLSIHASTKFADQKPRHMVIVQPPLDINVFMQTLGRIRRTGMKEGSAKYTLFALPVEAERRPMAVLTGKMKSLNANTSADSASSMDIKSVDMLNKYGDQIAAEYLHENPDVQLMTGMDVEVNLAGDVVRKEDDARRLTGRIAILSNEIQTEVYTALAAAYNERVEALKAAGQYDLEMTSHDDWDAQETGEPEELSKGKKGGNGFQAPVTLRQFSIKDSRKPPTKAKVVEEFRANFDSDFKDKLFAELAKEADAYVGTTPADEKSLSLWEFRRNAVAEARYEFEQMYENEIGSQMGSLIGATFDDTGDVFDGAITKLRHRKSKVATNPYRLAKFTVEMMVTSPVGKIRFTLQDVKAGRVDLGAPVSSTTFDDFDAAQAKDFRTTRHIMTGNLLRAMEITDAKGRVVSFTDTKGKKQVGLLMPRSFTGGDIANDPRKRLQTPAAVMHYLDNMNYGIAESDRYVTTPGDFQIRRIRDDAYQLSAPKSKAAGGKYFLNGDITKVTGDFTSVGNRMTVAVTRSEAEAVVRVVQKRMSEWFVPAESKDQAGIDAANEAAGGRKGRGKGGNKGGDDDAVGMIRTRSVGLRPIDPLRAALGMPQVAPMMPMSLSAPNSPVDPTNAPEIIEKFGEAIEAFGNRVVPIRIGRMSSRKAEGSFWPRREVIRIRTANDIETAAHEAAHAIEKMIYGFPAGSPWRPKYEKAITKPLQNELVALGKALYGNTAPTGGYRREGFAEYFRLWLINPAVAKQHAPQFDAWFNSEFLEKNDKGTARLMEARKMIQDWQLTGSAGRMKQSVNDPASLANRMRHARGKLRKFVSKTTHIDTLHPLDMLSQTAAKMSGKPISPENDPYAVGSGLRMMHASRLKEMVRGGIMDIAGNRTGGPALQDIRPLVKGRFDDFVIYLWARRALSMYNDRKGVRNPGVSYEDALQTFTELHGPEFERAASIVYQWNDGILMYAAQASPTFAQVVKAIAKRDPGNYIPLQREFRDLDQRAGRMRSGGGMGSAAAGSMVKRLKGSGRRINEPITAMIQNADTLLKLSHQRAVIDRIIAMGQKYEGLGPIIERVPRDVELALKTDAQTVLEEVNRRLDDYGVAPIDIAGLNQQVDLAGMSLAFFTQARHPKGSDPIVPIWDGQSQQLQWWYVDGELYNTLTGMDVFRLGDTTAAMVAEWTLAKPARLARAGTTSLRAAFSLITNPIRDLRSLMVNSRADRMALPVFMHWMRALGEAALYKTTGKRTAWVDAFMRLGLEMSLPLSGDIQHANRESRRLFEGFWLRTFDPRNWFDAYREFIQFPESAPRLAELRMVAKEIGWEPGQPMTMDQSVQLMLAAKQVTTDFTAAGEWGRFANAIIPFYNATIQGPRASLRALRDHPRRFIIRGMEATALALLLWWKYKDEDWWKELPWKEKSLYWHFPMKQADGQTTIMRLPRAFELDLVFAALPEALADAAYRENPEAMKKWWSTFRDASVPDIIPVVPKEILQQAWGQGGKDFFWDRPIVAGRYVQRPKEEQYNEYTSRAAILLGDAFDLSPMRIDHAIRTGGGPFVSDVIGAMGLGAKGVEREKEMADTFLVGHLFQRGGEMGTRPQSVTDLYDLLEVANQRHDSKRNPETEDERAKRLLLEDAAKAVSAFFAVRGQTEATDVRNKLTRAAVLVSRNAVEAAKGNKLDREKFADWRKIAEGMEKGLPKD